MTIQEAVNWLDEKFANHYSYNDKVQWLSDLDGILKLTLFDLRKGADLRHFAGYTTDTNPHTQLLVPYPFDDLYRKWMESKLHYLDGDMDGYNAAITLYNAALTTFKDYYVSKYPSVLCHERFRF